MSLPSGFVLKDSHLIRGVAAMVVISVLVPGIFGVGPPQYFSDDSVQLAASDSKTDGTARPTSGVDAETAETTEEARGGGGSSFPGERGRWPGGDGGHDRRGR